MKTAIGIALLVVSFTASAQVYKCPDAAGKITYSQAPCAGGTRGLPITGGTSNGIDAMSPREIQRASRTEPQPRGPQAVILGQHPAGSVPTSQQIKNLETSASSKTIGQKERAFLEAEVRRAKEAQRRGGTYTQDDWNDIKDAQSSQNRIDPADRAKSRRDAQSIHLGAGSEGVKTDIILERQAEEDRANARRAAAGRRTNLTNCDAAGCWDTSGQRYNRAAGEGNFFRQDGRACRTVAGQTTCD